MTNQNTALATVNHNAAIEPQNMGDLERLAKHAADSKFFGFDTVAQAIMVALRGKDLGFSYTQSFSSFHIIKNRPSLTADAMVGVCLQHKELCVFFEPVEQTETKATWRAQRVGREPVTNSYTIEEARAADLLSQNGGMWKKYPKRMLSARAKAFLARDLFPELLNGLLSVEEAQDIPDERHIAPVVRQVPAARPSPTHDADGVLTEDPRVAAMLARIDRAATLRDTQAIGAEVKATKGEYTADQLETLRQALAKQVADLKAIDAERARQPEIIDAEPVSPAPPAVEAAQ
jgi:hypothetical protein